MIPVSPLEPADPNAAVYEDDWWTWNWWDDLWTDEDAELDHRPRRVYLVAT